MMSNSTPTEPQDDPGMDGGTGDPNADRAFLMDQPPAELDADEQSGQAAKPSQAEGEDPDDEGEGEALPQSGHPSPAEGGDGETQ
jgi:hypothetical protein